MTIKLPKLQLIVQNGRQRTDYFRSGSDQPKIVPEPTEQAQQCFLHWQIFCNNMEYLAHLNAFCPLLAHTLRI